MDSAKTRLILLAILGLGTLLRIWGLDLVPPELFGDELDVGYQAFSLLSTGRDYYGQLLPTYIHSFPEWRAPLLMYATTPFVWLFGLNEWGLRLTTAFFGILNILLLYLLIDETQKNKKVALFGAFFLAIVPWHLQYSRSAFEVTLLMALMLAGAISFIRGVKRPIYLYLSAILFALTFYTYSTANLFTPLLITILIVVCFRKLISIPKKHLLLSVGLFVVISLPISYHILFGSAATRYKEFSIFADTEVVAQINEKRIVGGDDFSEKLLHNRPIGWGRRIMASYFTSLSPQYLFIDGDVTFRHSVHEIGPLFWAMMPLIIYGIYNMTRKKNRYNYLWFGWALIAPIPAALTKDGSIHATRLFLLLPPLITFAAVGFDSLLNKKGKLAKTLVAGVFFVLLIEFGMYMHRYWVHYPVESWRWWHSGYKDAITYMKDSEDEYELIVFNDSYEPALIRFLFWWEYSPEKFLEVFTGNNRESGVLPGFNGFELEDRYYFGIRDEDLELQDFVTSEMLYLVSQRDEVAGDWDWEKDQPPGNLKVLKTIRNPYGEVIFYVVTSNPQSPT